MSRHKIDLSRDVAPICGYTHRIRTLHPPGVVFGQGRRTSEFTLDRIVEVTLPLVRIGAPPTLPTIEIFL